MSSIFCVGFSELKWDTYIHSLYYLLFLSVYSTLNISKMRKASALYLYVKHVFPPLNMCKSCYFFKVYIGNLACWIYQSVDKIAE